MKARYLLVSQNPRFQGLIMPPIPFAVTGIPVLPSRGDLVVIDRNAFRVVDISWYPKQEDASLTTVVVSLDEDPGRTKIDNAPHSRACGAKAHNHGEDCNPNCPTCYGQNDWRERG